MRWPWLPSLRVESAPVSLAARTGDDGVDDALDARKEIEHDEQFGGTVGELATGVTGCDELV